MRPMCTVGRASLGVAYFVRLEIAVWSKNITEHRGMLGRASVLVRVHMHRYYVTSSIGRSRLRASRVQSPPVIGARLA